MALGEVLPQGRGRRGEGREDREGKKTLVSDVGILKLHVHDVDVLSTLVVPKQPEA